MRCTCTAELEPNAAFCGHCGQRVRRRRSLLGLVLDDRYRVDQKIATGGFAVVYRATHVPTGAEVALKVLSADLADNPELNARFRREGNALASLRDPHTVETYELGESYDGTLYIAMELLRGESLLARFRARGALPWRQALAIGRAVCSSLCEAHALGIIHRDLKPANIHLEARPHTADFVKVLDFGVAKLAQGGLMDDGIELTRAGEAVGTIDYMAPEQLVGGACDGRTDIYSLGVVMYELITGRRPFADATTPTSLVAAVLARTAAPPSTIYGGEFLPPELDGVLLRCLEREPSDRFNDVRELATALDRMLAVSDNTARRAWNRAAPIHLLAGDEATWIDSVPPCSDGSAGAVQHALALEPTQPTPRHELPPPTPEELAIGSAEQLLPMFEVPVVGTDVGPNPNGAPLNVITIAAWAVILLAIGLGLGAIIAQLT